MHAWVHETTNFGGTYMTRFYHDEDADLSILEGRTIAVIGYGNQGRAQALNMRDNGLNVIVGNIDDDYKKLAIEDGFEVHSIEEAAKRGNIISLLLPDEVAPNIYKEQIERRLTENKVINFASGYNIAFGYIEPPPFVDVIMVAPRCLGRFVRERFERGVGFPSFFGVGQDYSGKAKAIALAIAKAIGSTRMGVLEIGLEQEAYVDLFSEQGFGPILGAAMFGEYVVLQAAGIPPEAILIEMYVSGELAETFKAMAEIGLIKQMDYHSRTSQFGSVVASLNLDFEVREAITNYMKKTLEKIKSGKFARKWKEDMNAGYPLYNRLRKVREDNELAVVERRVRKGLRMV